MGYDCGDSFPFDFEPNGIPFGSENRNENCHHDHVPFNVEGNGNIVFSVCMLDTLLFLHTAQLLLAQINHEIYLGEKQVLFAEIKEDRALCQTIGCYAQDHHCMNVHCAGSRTISYLIKVGRAQSYLIR